MNKICIGIGAFVFGSIGWWLGSFVGFGTAYVVSGIGSLVGAWVGWRVNRDYLE